LRDTTLPTWQSELDEFSQTLTTRFDSQGLTLFTDASGAVPPSGGLPVQAGYVGYSGSIQVNAAVAADPSLVRDGTHAVPGSATGPSAFLPNPSGGPAGFDTLISRVLNFALGAQAQSGVPQPAAATAGLGPAGNLSAPYAPSADLAGLATAVVAAQAQESGEASAALTSETAVQTALKSRLSSTSGVSMDSEMATMVQLQSSYAATARLVSAVQSLWDATLRMMQ
jgi:flagellar hook-associated protein 1 FlgK